MADDAAAGAAMPSEPPQHEHVLHMSGDPLVDSVRHALEPVLDAATQLFQRVLPHLEAYIDAVDMPEQLRVTLKDPLTWVVLAGLLMLLFIVAFIGMLKPKKQRNAVLIVGPCDAGKTTLFLQLREGSALNGTVASMVVNDDTFALHSEEGKRTAPVRVVDVPGHPRVRGLFERYVGSARGVVFLVDSCDFMPRKTEAAEQLYELLSHPTVLSRRLPVLLACNKSDMGLKAHTPEFIRKMLEKEIDQLRSTRGALEDTHSGGGGVQLGRRGEPFSFDALAKVQGIKVTLASASALDAEGVRGVEEFIRACVPA